MFSDKQTMHSASNLIWVDLEMTGLKPDQDVVIEIATIVTDSELNTLAEGPVIAVHQSDAILDGMDEWNTTHHNRSGLVDRVKASQYDAKRTEQETIAFLEQWVPRGSSPMCGNTICQDRRFMARLLPQLEAYFHYRNLDVSTLKILMQRWMIFANPSTSCATTESIFLGWNNTVLLQRPDDMFLHQRRWIVASGQQGIDHSI